MTRCRPKVAWGRLGASNSRRVRFVKVLRFRQEARRPQHTQKMQFPENKRKGLYVLFLVRLLVSGCLDRFCDRDGQIGTRGDGCSEKCAWPSASSWYLLQAQPQRRSQGQALPGAAPSQRLGRWWDKSPALSTESKPSRMGSFALESLVELTKTMSRAQPTALLCQNQGLIGKSLYVYLTSYIHTYTSISI